VEITAAVAIMVKYNNLRFSPFFIVKLKITQGNISINLSEGFNILQGMLATNIFKKCTTCATGYIVGPNSKNIFYHSPFS